MAIAQERSRPSGEVDVHIHSHTHEDKKPRKVIRKVGTVAIAALAVVSAAEMLSNWDPTLNPFKHQPASGKATMNMKSYRAETSYVKCSDEVTALAGVKVHNPYTPAFDVAIGAVDINKAIPIKFRVCGADGIKNVANVNYTNGKEVVTSALPDYYPTDVGVDDLNPIMCAPGIKANSTLSQANAAVAVYKREARAGKAPACDIGEGVTGFMATGSTAGGADELGRRLSVVAGTLQALPSKTQRKVYNDARQHVIDFDRHQYPGATINVEMPEAPSAFESTLTGLGSIESDLDVDFQNIRFTEGHGFTTLNLTSNNATGEVVLHERLTNGEVATLNHAA